MKDGEPVGRKENELASGTVTNAQMGKIIADAVAEALKVAIPAAAVGINAANQQASNKTREAVVKEVLRRTERCPICALPKSACGGGFAKDKDGNDIVEKDESGGVKYNPSANHLKYYVGPREDSLFRWFQGVKVNGVLFLSDRIGHQIWIPKKSDIPTIINNWERNEKELSQKRSAEGNGAGAIGQQGQVINRGNQGAIGWR